MTESFCRQMRQEAGDQGIVLDHRQLEQLYLYYEMLSETNKVMNLTAITEESEVVTKHFSDSLSLVRAFGGGDGFGKYLEKGVSLIDVGTGAGFPGIPLKILFSGMRVTLLDSLNKRVKFLQDVCNKLELKEVMCIHGRAEDIGRQEEHREAYDLCVSRAVANLATLSEYCVPFVKIGGCFVPYKSGEIEEELEQSKKAVFVLGGKIEKVEKFTLPGSDAARSLVVIRKISATAGKYPRKAGMPAKEPLGA
ncbi:MAG: 16S rRNA (guanine(527)-N(7))-methyltransferase RsmG [Clostridium sp.]|nr:16S rRNA (guanine(527)-N(7))-methyltransferase RsmG [Clostridium sp.]